MSIIQAVITNNYALISGDSRCTCVESGRHISGFNKIIKLNNNVMFGCTGDPLDNFKLFDGFCYYHTRAGFRNSDESFDVSYNDFVDIISNRFNKMYGEHKSGDKSYDIGSLICGFNGKEFKITSISFGSKMGNPDGMSDVPETKDFPYKGAIIGLPEHIDKFETLTNELHQKYQRNFTIRQFKNIMQEVVDEGSKFDDTIDNDLNFETIRRVNKNGIIYYT